MRVFEPFGSVIAVKLPLTFTAPRGYGFVLVGSSEEALIRKLKRWKTQIMEMKGWLWWTGRRAFSFWVAALNQRQSALLPRVLNHLAVEIPMLTGFIFMMPVSVPAGNLIDCKR